MAIRQRGASWQADVTVSGKRVRQDFTTKEAAERWEAEARAAVLNGRPVPAGREVTGEGKTWALGTAVEEAGKKLWSDGKRHGHLARTVYCPAALEFFGTEKPLDDINAEALDEYVEHLRDEEGNAPATINRKLSALSSVMRFAYDRERMGRLPRLPRQREDNLRLHWIEKDEETLMLDTLRLWGKDDHADAVEVLADTGLRCGELWRLTRQDVRNRALTVWQSKNGKPRTVPLTERAEAVLKRRMIRTKHGETLFPFDNDWMRNTWDRLRAKLGHAEHAWFTPHILRHTCACRLAMKGAHLLAIKDWLGHSSVVVTQRYAVVAPSALRDAARMLDNFNSAAPPSAEEARSGSA